jgi:hypothetical protein
MSPRNGFPPKDSNPTAEEPEMKAGQEQVVRTKQDAADIVGEALRVRTLSDARSVSEMIAAAMGKKAEIRFMGDRSNNATFLQTSGDSEHIALEPATNMQDTVLERGAWERYGDPSAVKATYPREAVAELLGGLSRQELATRARVDIYQAGSDPRRSRDVTLVYRDLGCGLTPAQVPESIFFLGSSTKDAYPWMSGAFGLGGATTYANSEAVVLVTRRLPEALSEGDEDRIVVTVGSWEKHNKGRGIRYLVGPDRAPFSVPASDFPEFEPGTHLALIGYKTRGFYRPGLNEHSFRALAQTRLWEPPVPILVENHVARGEGRGDVVEGLKRRFEKNPHPEIEQIEDDLPFRIGGRTYKLPVRIHVFPTKSGTGGKSKVGAMRHFVAPGHAVMFTANGQAHMTMDTHELRRHVERRLAKVQSTMLVVVELDPIPVDVRTQELFTADRSAGQKSQARLRLDEQLGKMLIDQERLLEINGIRTREQVERAGDQGMRAVAERIKALLAAKGGFGGGRKPDTGGEPQKPKRWAKAELYADPTTLEGPERIRVKPGETRFFRLFINATEDFLAERRGAIELTCDHELVGPDELVAGDTLRRGIVRASVLVPDEVPVGTRATIEASLRGWIKKSGGVGRDHVWPIRLEVVDPETGDPSPRKPKKRTSPDVGGMPVVLWSNGEHERLNASVPGVVEELPASEVASKEEYADLASLGEAPVVVVQLNKEYRPLRDYMMQRAKRRGEIAQKRSEGNYATGVGVGLVRLRAEVEDAEKKGKKLTDKDLAAAHDAVARSVLAVMPEYEEALAGYQNES